MRLRLAPYLRKPPPIFASGKHFVQLYHWQTSHTQKRYMKYCSLQTNTFRGLLHTTRRDLPWERFCMFRKRPRSALSELYSWLVRSRELLNGKRRPFKSYTHSTTPQSSPVHERPKGEQQTCRLPSKLIGKRTISEKRDQPE